MSIVTGNVTTATSAMYTSVGNTAVMFFSLTNYSAANVTANVYVVPNGNSASNLNMVVSQLSITTHDTYQLYAGNEKLLLSNGDSIQTDCSANNSVSVVSSYTAM